MGNLIVPEQIPGFTVYGVQQVQYTVDGEAGQDFSSAVTCAAFKQSTAIEAACMGYSEVVKSRQRKVDTLGEMLAYINEANAKLPTDSKTPSKDKVSVDHASWIKSMCNYYGISLKWDGNSDKMVRGNLQKAQTEVQYQIDKEDNILQQDMVTLQSYISKRDNAYSTASKVVKKTLGAGSVTISNFGS